LVSYVFTADEGRALRLTRALDFGVVGINDVRVVAPEMPFGGMKESGLGRENGEEGLAEYLETKSIVTTVA
jgi:succinate-semialdehyde dehydrogenase/glutarate-semialdehyde dehydrogenase